MTVYSDQTWLSPWILEKALESGSQEQVDLIALATNLPSDYVLPGALATRLMRSEIFNTNFRLAELLMPHIVVTLSQALEHSEISVLLLRRAIELEAGTKGKATFLALCNRLIPRLTHDKHVNFFDEISSWLLSDAAVVNDINSRLTTVQSEKSSFSDILYVAVKSIESPTFAACLLQQFQKITANAAKTFAFFEALIERSEISKHFRSLEFCWETIRRLHVYRPREDADGRMKQRLLWTLEISPNCWTTLLAIDPSVVLTSNVCRKMFPQISDHTFLSQAVDFLLKKGTLAEYLADLPEISDHINEAIAKVSPVLDVNLPLLRLCITRGWWTTLQAVIGNCKVEISKVSDAMTVFDEILASLEKSEIPNATLISASLFFVDQIQPWLTDVSLAQQISDRVLNLLGSVSKEFRPQAAAIRLLLAGNFLSFGHVLSRDDAETKRLVDRAVGNRASLDILTQNVARLRFLATVTDDAAVIVTISDHVRDKFPTLQICEKFRGTQVSDCAEAMDVEDASQTQPLDATEYLLAVRRDLESCQNVRALWEPLIFSHEARSLPSDAQMLGRNFREISDLLDFVIAESADMSRVYAMIMALEVPSMRKSLGSKRVTRIAAWLECGNEEILSRAMPALAMAARSQPHLRVCEKLLDISTSLIHSSNNFRSAYWCSYVALVSGRDRTGEQSPWWLLRTEKVLRNFRSFANHADGVPHLLRLVETVSGNLSSQFSLLLAGPLVLDIVDKFPCAQENALKPVVFTLFGTVGNAGIKNFHAVCDQRQRDILKALIDEFNLRHKFRGKV